MALSVTWIEENLVATISKKELLLTLKEWREEATSKDEASVISDLIARVRSGDLDG